ncbi:MAG: class I SAM-dependent methyltransferase [Clostridia bacterium]
MLDLLVLQKEFLLKHIKNGSVVCDFTMGNGHDTLFLSQTVGNDGMVYAFDIQPSACEATQTLLAHSGCPKNYTLINDSHSNCDKYIHQKINGGVFNLGYLPGGDKNITTLRKSTLSAVNLAIELLAPDGILIVAVYPGHPEGTAEGYELFSSLALRDRREICVTQIKIINSPTSPFFFIIERK